MKLPFKYQKWAPDSLNKTTFNIYVICFENISYHYFSSGVTYDIPNKHRLGYTEVQLVPTMIDGVNKLYEKRLEIQKNTSFQPKESKEDFVYWFKRTPGQYVRRSRWISDNTDQIQFFNLEGFYAFSFALFWSETFNDFYSYIFIIMAFLKPLQRKSDFWVQ